MVAMADMPIGPMANGFPDLRQLHATDDLANATQGEVTSLMREIVGVDVWVMALGEARYEPAELKRRISGWLGRTPTQTHDPLGLLEMASQLEAASR